MNKPARTRSLGDLVDNTSAAAPVEQPAAPTAPAVEIPELENADDGARLTEDHAQLPATENRLYVFHVLAGHPIVGGRGRRPGETVEVREGTQAFRDTVDIEGRSWLRDLDDEAAQTERFGRRLFAPGPWVDDRIRRLPVPSFVQGDEQVRAWHLAVSRAVDALTDR